MKSTFFNLDHTDKNKEKRDFWSKLQIVSGILASVMIPLVIFWIGTQMNRREAERDVYQRNIDRVTTMIKSLSNGNTTEKVLTLKLANHLIKTEQFPEELVPVIFSLTETDTNRIVAEAATETLQKAAKQSEEIRESFKDILKDLNPLVYIQYVDPRNRELALKLQKSFRSRGLNAPGIELVEEADITEDQLRYFSQDEKVLKVAEKIREIMLNELDEVEMVDLSGRYKSVNANILEVWLK